MSNKTTIYRLEFFDGTTTHSEDFDTLFSARASAKILQTETTWRSLEIFEVTTEVSKKILETLPVRNPPAMLPPNTRQITFEDAQQIVAQCKYWKGSTKPTEITNSRTLIVDDRGQPELRFKEYKTGFGLGYTKVANAFFVSTNDTEPYVGVISQDSYQSYVYYFFPYFVF